MTGSARLFSLKYMMKAATTAADVVVSLQAGPGRLTGEERETQNVKLEHQVPPTGYSHTDTCRKRLQSCVHEGVNSTQEHLCVSYFNRL